MTPMQRHAVANAIQNLEAMEAMCDMTPQEFFEALKEQARRLRRALSDEDTEK